MPLPSRAIYERFGAPVAVLHPGLHFILPWPMGRVHRMDFGAVHDLPFGDAPPRQSATAEGPAPAEADRLWQGSHAGEVTLAVASAGAGHQNPQSVSADLRLLYRVGLSDAQAMQAATCTADPDALVRAMAGRAITAAVAGKTLAELFSAHRESFAQNVRTEIQAELDRLDSGLVMVAVVVEAIHPPAGAADAYHAVRAAEIAAQASVASERGNAIVIRAQSGQYADQQVAQARAQAAETVEAARTALLGFSADRAAARDGGQAFLLERYFASLSHALAKTPKIIIDHRLNYPEAPVLDLRPPAAAPPSGEKGD